MKKIALLMYHHHVILVEQKTKDIIRRRKKNLMYGITHGQQVSYTHTMGSQAQMANSGKTRSISQENWYHRPTKILNSSPLNNIDRWR